MRLGKVVAAILVAAAGGAGALPAEDTCAAVPPPDRPADASSPGRGPAASAHVDLTGVSASRVVLRVSDAGQADAGTLSATALGERGGHAYRASWDYAFVPHQGAWCWSVREGAGRMTEFRASVTLAAASTFLVEAWID